MEPFGISLEESMKPDGTLDLSKFLQELHQESDRGLALVAAALIDEKLFEILRAFFCIGKTADRLLSGANAPLGTFSSKTDACFALGLVDEFEHKEISVLKKVRNEFAHARHGTSFQTEKIRGLCSNFIAERRRGESHPTDDPRLRFINATVDLVLRLHDRGASVEKERRMPKTWVHSDLFKWRSVEGKLLPPSILVMVQASIHKKS